MYGETLKANLSGIDSTGTMYYLWLVDGFRKSPITSSDTYTLSEGDIGKKISVQIFLAEEEISKTSEATGVVEKADGITPDVPTPKEKTETSITINAVSGQEYKLDDGAWQDSAEFTSLTANTQYCVYARAKETSTHKPSKVSPALRVTTNALPTLPSVDGNKQKIIVGTDKDVTFKTGADFSEFVSLEYNGALVDKANYTAKSGSIIITLKGDYVKTLGVGEHIFTANIGQNIANKVPMILSVKKAEESTLQTPDTGDNDATILYLALALISIIGVGFIVYRRKMAK